MISIEAIRELAALARIKLTGKEEVGLQKEVSNILEYVGQVSALESTPAQEKPPLHNVMREDIPWGEGSVLLGKREALLKAFPEREGDYLKVRKIITKDE